MKRKILIAFLLVLYIVPMILVPSPSTIVAEPNMNKDFALATDYAVSEQSITSFSETLPDDVLFFPDSIANDSVLASSGQDDYTDSFVIDATTWSAFEDNREYADFDCFVGQTSFSYSCYAYGFQGEGYLSVWNSTAWILLETFTETVGIFSWYNGTVDNSATIIDGIIRLGISGFDPWGYAAVDYLQISYDYMTLADSNHYAESFADVSDWATSDASISTDDDVATITENGAGSTGRAYASMSSTDFFEYYYEFRIVSMTATTANFEFWDGAGYNTLKTFTAAGTYKGIISDSDATTMQRIGFLVGSEGGNVKPDYLRIFRGNESGFCHDGSTTAGVADDGNVGWAYSYSTDGDQLTITGTRGTGGTDWGAIWLQYDTTSTSVDIERDYYPFFELSWSCTSYSLSSSNLRVMPFVDGYYLGWAEAYGTNFAVGNTFAQRTDRLNLKALTATTSNKYLLFYFYSTTAGQSATIKVDYAKYYSIANYTYTGTGVSTDDVLYVSSNTLYASVISITSIVLDHDPALSVDTSTYDIWNVTTSSGVPQFDHYVSSWQGYSSETMGTLATGTLTDVRIKFTDSANIAAIEFLYVIPEWHEVGEATLYFSVPFDYWALNMALIFGGLILMLLSTCIVAKKIRDRTITQDAGILLLFLFCVGWGLFIGGALIG